jgi:sugar O-acyltransferase (sialic acid O-acetyltransferase NeuD family)
MQNNLKVVIAGYGGFARECRDWLMLQKVSVQRYLADDDIACTPIDSYKRADGEQVLVAIGEPKDRAAVVGRLKAREAHFHGMLFNVAPPTAHIGGGCVFCPMSLVSSRATVGDFVHANVMSSIGHDVTVGDFCTLSSHVDLCGDVKLGTGVFLGSHAVVMPGVKVGDWARIGAGAIVVKDVEAGATVYAQPGRTM